MPAVLSGADFHPAPRFSSSAITLTWPGTPQRCTQIGTEPAVTHSQGEAPYTWQWAAEVYGALWETGQAVYGRAVMPDEL